MKTNNIIKTLLNMLDFLLTSKTGKIISSFLKPIGIAWLICFLVFGIPLTQANFGIKVLVIIISIINGFVEYMSIFEKSDDFNDVEI
jgi:hypothetical protein